MGNLPLFLTCHTRTITKKSRERKRRKKKRKCNDKSNKVKSDAGLIVTLFLWREKKSENC